MRHALLLILSFTLLTLVACGSEESASYDMASSSMASEVSYDYAVADTASVADDEVAVSHTSAAGANGAPLSFQTTAAQQRKIIYTTRVQLVVDEFEGVPKAVRDLANKHGGFVASSNIQGSEGEPRRGEWILRIPSTQYDTFVEGSKTLGQVRSLSSDSQEVTAEFVDLQARARNLKAEETRLHKHLDESTKSLKDILEVEREIARVRGEVERIEGRLNVLKDLTSLSTVTLSIEEIKDYIPEPTEEPGFTTQVARTWDHSIGGVGSFFTNLSLGIVSFIPWLAVILPIAIVGWLVLRKVRKHVALPIASATAIESDQLESNAR